MFRTYPSFKHPIQFDETSTLWRLVELALHWPWYIATVLDPVEQAQRVFLLSGNDDLLLLAEQEDLGRLVAVHLLMSPAFSVTRDWELVPIVSVGQLRDSPHGTGPMVVVTAADGKMYAGVPIEAMDEPEGQLVRLFDFAKVGKRRGARSDGRPKRGRNTCRRATS